ncbi:MAG: dienelactone hydrolase family protein [Clostridia bacterium]|nr:dienelactone hydrolase family protein [Clostridia bacterium]
MSQQTAHSAPLPAPCLSLRYLQYLPPEYENSDQEFPLVIFLHGSGERGEDLNLVAIHGWPRYVKEGRDYPFILVSPQLPDGKNWCGHIESLNGLLDHLQATLRVDKSRIYLTGLSNGGTGTWLWASSAEENPFAAIIPVCGAGVTWLSRELLKTPVWAFHGDQDTAIDHRESLRMVDQINAWGGNAQVTIYPGVGHNSWENAYTDPALIEWMLAQKRP